MPTLLLAKSVRLFTAKTSGSLATVTGRPVWRIPTRMISNVCIYAKRLLINANLRTTVYKTGVFWIQEQLESNGSLTDDTRYWYDVPPI